jgi:hypothetical protein
LRMNRFSGQCQRLFCPITGILNLASNQKHKGEQACEK